MSLLFEMERMKRIKKDIERNFIGEEYEITEYKMLEGQQKDAATCDTTTWTNYLIHTPWSKLEDHRWFRTTFTIPDSYDGKYVELKITTGREGQWDATNPQMLCYLNGEIIQGVDVNHREILVSGNAKAGKTYDLALYAFSGSVVGDLILHTVLQTVDQKVKKFYYDFSVLVDAADLLKENDERNCRKILSVLMDAIADLDLREPYSTEYDYGIDKASKKLEEAFYTTMTKDGPVVSAIGHTHIDIAWLWTVAQTREKTIRSFSTVLELMEQYPEYKFMSSQPILYQFVKEEAPKLYQKIKERVAEGRWEVDGAMWLESDCNIPNGESLVRQILKGHQFMKEEFDVESKSLWLPDVFGYSAAIPQILKKSRIPYFTTTKIAWNQYNQLPNDTFLWKGIDGSQVFVYMPTTSDYNNKNSRKVSFTDKMNTTTYTGIINPNMTLGTYQRFQNKDLSEDTLMLYGYGDGGGGPTKDMLEQAKRLSYGLPGIPRLKLEFEQKFLDRTYNKIAHLPDMPTWDGELYFEYHRGTYTSIAKNKLHNRRCENLYEQLEILSAMTGKNHEEQVQMVIQKGWDIILLNQFHDIVPGSSIKEVYEQTDIEYKKIEEDGFKLRQELLIRLNQQKSKQSKQFIVANTQGFKRNGMVIIPTKTEWVIDEVGNTYPVQKTVDHDSVIWVNDVPGLGYKVFQHIDGLEVAKEDKKTSKWEWNGTFENEYYSAKFNEKMELISLVERVNHRELLKENRVGNELILFEDRPMNWDNWDVDVYYQRKRFMPDAISKPVVTEHGPVRYTVQVKYQFGKSMIVQDIHFYTNSPRIDFENHANWQTHHVLLKANFPVNINSRKATFEIQYGNVERETTTNNSWDQAKFEVCGHKWMDFSEEGVGISLLNDCKYGYSAQHGEMALTLIKAGTYPNKDADMGEHEFTYSIYPHHQRWQEAQTICEAYNLNVPLIASEILSNEFEQESFNEVKWEENYLSCSQKNCFVETIKSAEDGNGNILRLYENENKAVDAVITINDGISKAWEVNLLEEIEQPLEINEGKIKIHFNPYEIKSIKWLNK